MRGSASPSLLASCSSSPAIGSSIFEWKACAFCTRRQIALARHQSCLKFRQRGRCSGDDAEARTVEQADRELGRQERGKLALRQRDREHRGLGQRAHQLRAHGEEPQRVLERHHAGEAGGDVFAHAVADDRVGYHAERLPEPRHRVLDAEQRRLSEQRLAQRARALQHPPQIDALAGRLRAFAVRVEHLADVAPEQRLEDRRAAVDFLPEDRLALVEPAAHADVLVAHPGKQQHHRAPRFARGRGNAASPRAPRPGSSTPRSRDAQTPCVRRAGCARRRRGWRVRSQELAQPPGRLFKRARGFR